MHDAVFIELLSGLHLSEFLSHLISLPFVLSDFFTNIIKPVNESSPCFQVLQNELITKMRLISKEHLQSDSAILITIYHVEYILSYIPVKLSIFSLNFDLFKEKKGLLC